MAKCTHCSAPLPKSGIVCEYCGVRNDIDLGKKKFVNLRPHLNRECPICSIKLQTINVGEKLDFFIERCESCYGIFFDPNELEEMLEFSVKGSKNVDLIKLAHISENPRYVDILTYRKCPVCKKTMHRKNFMKRSGVITDVCFEHGVWLDSGELRHIMEWIKVGGMTKLEESTPLKSRKISSTKIPKNAEYSGTKETEMFETLFDALFTLRW
ncbi:MAG: zf-TFIIB domain-containing protein [Campylobacterota bacterium]|nr:zf-TFIIB domain-containing protein [Campylobacterota bacterium]